MITTRPKIVSSRKYKRRLWPGTTAKLDLMKAVKMAAQLSVQAADLRPASSVKLE
jgi:hypothetical protein